MHVSLAHAPELVAVALARTPVGVDVEATVGAAVSATLLGDLHPAETAEVVALPERHRPAAFTRAWVRTEALLKAMGTGLARRPDVDDTGEGTGRGTHGWRIADVEPRPGLHLGVAVAEPCRTVVVRRIGP